MDIWSTHPSSENQRFVVEAPQAALTNSQPEIELKLDQIKT
jgi:hypothetical protein